MTRTRRASWPFTVKVVDTTPPEPCPLSDIMVGTNSGAGAIVDYATCANDIVDGPVALVCDHPPGSFFPFGTTLVRCFATDSHGNKSDPETFAVKVGDTTPPVLKMPTVVTADRDQQDRRARQLHGHRHRQRRSEPEGEVQPAVGVAVPARQDAGQLHGDGRRRATPARARSSSR